MSYENMKKAELVQVAKKLESEIKSLNKRLNFLQGEREQKSFHAYSTLLINGVPSTVKIRYSVEDIEQAEKFIQGLHMAEFRTKSLLIRSTKKNKQEYEGSEANIPFSNFTLE